MTIMIIYVYFFLAVPKYKIQKEAKLKKLPYLNISDLFQTKHDWKRSKIL